MRYLALLICLGLWRPTPAHSQSDGWEQEIRAAEGHHVKAFLAHDVAGLDSMLADDFVVNSPQDRVVEKAELMRMVKGGVLNLSGFEQKIERVRRFGDMVVVMGEDRVIFSPPSPMAGRTQRRRFTDIWQLRNQEWSFVARQATVVR